MTTIRTIFLLALLVSIPVAAQNTYTACDVTEFCYCSDGSGAGTSMTLICPDSVGTDMTILMCSGQMPGDFSMVLHSYSGIDFTGTPIPGLTGHFPNLSGAQAVSFSDNAIHMVFVESPSTVGSCVSGDFDPIRFLVWSGMVSPWPTVGDCVGINCFPTSIGETAGSRSFIGPNPTDGILLVEGQGTIRVMDMSGRVVLEDPFTVQAGGRRTVDMRGLQSGQYMVQLTTANWTKTQRVQVAR